MLIYEKRSKSEKVLTEACERLEEGLSNLIESVNLEPIAIKGTPLHSAGKIYPYGEYGFVAAIAADYSHHGFVCVKAVPSEEGNDLDKNFRVLMASLKFREVKKGTEEYKNGRKYI